VGKRSDPGVLQLGGQGSGRGGYSEKGSPKTHFRNYRGEAAKPKNKRKVRKKSYAKTRSVLQERGSTSNC